MEKLEIKYTANEMFEKSIKKDVEYINEGLDNAFCDVSVLNKGYTFIAIQTQAAIKMLQDKGFEVTHGEDSSFDDVYKVSWDKTNMKEQA